MWTRTFTAQVGDNGSQNIITFYREIPGGWKLDFRDAEGQYIANGDRWVESIDDLVVQLGNFTDDDLTWHTEEDEPVSFYAAVKECTLHSQIT